MFVRPSTGPGLSVAQLRPRGGVRKLWPSLSPAKAEAWVGGGRLRFTPGVSVTHGAASR